MAYNENEIYPIISGLTSGDTNIETTSGDTEIGFVVPSLALIAGQSANTETLVTLISRYNINSANWSAMTTGVTQLNCWFENISTSTAMLVVDTHNATNPEMGEIKVTVYGDYIADDGDYLPYSYINYLPYTLISPPETGDTGTTILIGKATFDPSALTISGSGSYTVDVTANETGGGNWSVGLRDNSTTSYGARFSIITENSNTCRFRINYDTFTYNDNDSSIIRLELHNTGGDIEYVYYYDYVITEPYTGTTGTTIMSGTATFNPSTLVINKNGSYNVKVSANETGGGNWTVFARKDKPLPTNTDAQFSIVTGGTNGCEFRITNTNTNFENITDRTIYLELHNSGSSRDYVYYYNYTEEKVYSKIENNIEFLPSNFVISGGTSGTIYSELTSNKTFDNATWSVRKVNDTGVDLYLTQDNLYDTTLVIDASLVTAATTGNIEYNVSYTYTEENGDVISSADSFTYYYQILDVKPDSTPVLNFSPTKLNLSGETNTNLYATIEMSGNTILSSTWSAEITGDTQLSYSFTSTGTTTSTLYIETDGATKNESGYIRYSVDVTYKSNDNTEKTETVTSRVRYNLVFEEIPMENSITFTPSSINKMAGDVDYVYSELVSNKEFTNVVWDAIVVGNSDLQIELTQDNFYDTTLRIDSSNALSGETGTIRYTGTFSYTGVDNETITTAQTFNYSYVYTENSGNTIPVELVASPSTLNLTNGVSVLTVSSNVDIFDWVNIDNNYLNVSFDYDSTNRQGIFYISPVNGLKESVSTTLTIRAFINEDKSKYSDISIPVVITINDVIPVWKNNLIGLNTEIGDNIKYSVVDTSTNNILYSGRIVKLSNGDVVDIDVNKIVGNFLSNHFPNTLPEGLRLNDITDYAKTVDIRVNNSIIDTITIYNSWGYSDIPYTNIISDPIRKIVDKRQLFVCSVYCPESTNSTVRYQLKKGSNITNRTTITANNNKQVLITDNGLKNTSYDEIVVGDLTYKIVDTCKEWCLYYSNAYGGWDSLIVDGNVLKSDKITSHYFNQLFNNTTYQFEKTKYLNVINSSYVLYTDWFNDDEQSRLYHLLESTEVYLHNMVTGEFLPVNITNTDCQYKTFTNNGKKKWYNTINVEVSQERIRK